MYYFNIIYVVLYAIFHALSCSQHSFLVRDIHRTLEILRQTYVVVQKMKFRISDEDQDLLLDVMALDEIAFISYQNGRKGPIGARLIQSLAIQSMCYCIHHRGYAQLSLAIRWTINNIKHQSHMKELTLRTWFNHFESYGECPYQTEERYGSRKWKSNLKNEQNGHKGYIIEEAVFQSLMANLDRDPTLYLDEMQKFLLDRHQVKCSISAIQTALKEHNITRKQVYSKASQVIEARRLAFIHQMRSTITDVNMALFIDETHKDRVAARRKYGWSKKGVKINHYEPFDTSDKLNYTMIGAADCFGFVADMCEIIDRNDLEDEEQEVDLTAQTPKGVNSARFKRYVIERVIPRLGNFLLKEKHSVVIWDNCSIHMDPELERLIRQAGAILIYSAPYACELIPIEFMFNSYKSYLKRHSRQLHWDFNYIHASALNHLTPTAGLNLFRKTTLTELVDDHPLLQQDSSRSTRNYFCIAVVAMDI